MKKVEPQTSFYSPLRYPGGKGKVAGYVKQILRLNRLEGCQYVEPYAGGAAVALELLFHEYAQHIHINDVDSGVAAFWQSVLHDTENLCRLISGAKLNMKEWNRQRTIAFDEQSDRLSLGYATFYMNRTNRSGILRAGVIGGKEQDGKWKLDARFNRPELVARIERIASLAHRIKFTQLDSAELLMQLPNTADTFLYLDPPYFGKGKDLYTHFYEDSDHKAIAQAVRKLTVSKWIVSYDDVDRISELYGRFRCIRYSLSYSAQERYRGGEIMFFSPKLVIPEFVGSMRQIDLIEAA